MKKESIENLINRYLDGTSTNREECILRHYFADEKTVYPPEWAVYKALFAYESSGGKPSSGRQMWTLGSIVSAAAAAVLLFLLLRPATPSVYAVIDGRRTTDLQVVQAEMEAALGMVAMGNEEPFDDLQLMTE